MTEYESAARIQRVAVPAEPVAAPADLRTRSFLWLQEHPWFTGIVLIPSLIATLYFGLIASDIYVSETRYIVRSVNNSRMSLVGTVLQNTGLVPSQDEAYSVRDFILSRDITRKLEKAHDLRGVLSRPEGDFVSRFPPPFTRDNFEELYKSYQDYVTVTVDDTTRITTLRVKAFRPDDAYNMANAILRYSEDLINKLNDRARHDAIDVAEREVRRCEQHVADAQAALTAYRLQSGLVDPLRTSGAVMDLVAKLSGELAGQQAQLNELLRGSPDSPLIPSLKRRIAAVQTQIAAERSKVVSGKGTVLTFSEYERLMLEREFADKELASAMASLETARLEAQRKQIYLDRIVEPNRPDYPLYPQRLLSILEVVLSLLLIYGIGWLISASVREHAGR